VAIKIGLVGYKGSGKSTLFEWLTGTPGDPALSHAIQSEMAPAPDDRVDSLCKIYSPKKVTIANLEIVDTPGLNRDHEGSAAKLALIREAGCLVQVIGAYDDTDPFKDLGSFDDDLLIADLDLVSTRVDRLREAVKKPRPNRDEQIVELAALEPLLESLENGVPMRDVELTPDQEKATKSFQLLTQKPRFVVFNAADDEEDFARFEGKAPEGADYAVVPLRLQVDLQKMSPEEREEFCAEMGVSMFDRDQILRQLMNASQQMLFFTAGEKEVRTWMIPQGATAVDAAGSIHTDLAKGFIRAAVMNIDDLVRLGGERELKAANLLRQEPKHYVIQDGDILEIRHN